MHLKRDATFESRLRITSSGTKKQGPPHSSTIGTERGETGPRTPSLAILAGEELGVAVKNASSPKREEKAVGRRKGVLEKDREGEDTQSRLRDTRGKIRSFKGGSTGQLAHSIGKAGKGREPRADRCRRPRAGSA